MIVDQFSKYIIFILALDAYLVEKFVRLFFNNVVKYFDLSKDIISDKDTRFTRKFLVILFKLLGLELKLSTTNHP